MLSCSNNNSVSPDEDIDVCEITSCPENANLTDCTCLCNEGYFGEKCNELDVSFTQKYLDDGVSPFVLLDSNIPIDSIFGRKFQEGYVFHLNTVAKIVKVADLKDSDAELNWPEAIDYCGNLEINNFSDWYLPNINELQEIRVLLYSKLKIGNFNDNYYWSSITSDNDPNDAMAVFFLNGNIGPIEKARVNPVSYNNVRAIRMIQL